MINSTLWIVASLRQIVVGGRQIYIEIFGERLVNSTYFSNLGNEKQTKTRTTRTIKGAVKRCSFLSTFCPKCSQKFPVVFFLTSNLYSFIYSNHVEIERKDVKV